MSNVIQFPVIAGIEIHTDDEGRFNLNALHRASGLGKSKQPSNWLRLDSTKALIDELLNSSDLRSSVIASAGGVGGGTFAHELLAISFAGWISPRFQLQVNQVFLDYKNSTATSLALPDFNNPAEAARAWATEFEQKTVLALENDTLKTENEHLTRLFQEGMSIVDFARTLNGVNIQQIQKYLASKNWLINGGFSGYKAASHYRDHYIADTSTRWFHPLSGEEQATFKPVILKKGAARLFKMYLKGELPMKANWNGSYGHGAEAMA
jgi:hypothetical protein